MDAPIQFVEYWYFHVPNYVLAALMYSLVARFMLSFVFARSHQLHLPLLRAADRPGACCRPLLTPRAVPPLLTVLLSVVWLLMLRFALLVGFASAGLAPTIAG